MMHLTAIIHPEAEVDPTVEVGPYVVIDEGVRIGAGCRIGPHVYLTGETEIGRENVFHAGCVIGDAPQDLKYRGEPTRVTIGDGNVFREHVTIHRPTDAAGVTRVGSNNFLMANVHLGHNVCLGDFVIIANGALLAGHVKVEDRAFISGNCLLHQNVRVGRGALMQGGAGVSLDVPPYSIAASVNTVVGLNLVGLKRAGVGPENRLELKKLYHAVMMGEGRMKERLEHARSMVRSDFGEFFIRFIEESQRGVCSHGLHGS